MASEWSEDDRVHSGMWCRHTPDGGLCEYCADNARTALVTADRQNGESAKNVAGSGEILAGAHDDRLAYLRRALHETRERLAHVIGLYDGARAALETAERERGDLRTRIDEALRVAGLRWAEWGDRAVMVADILDGAGDHRKGADGGE